MKENSTGERNHDTNVRIERLEPPSSTRLPAPTAQLAPNQIRDEKNNAPTHDGKPESNGACGLSARDISLYIRTACV